MSKIQLKLFPDKKPKNYADILAEAATVARDRQEQYGEAVESVKLACKILDETFNIKLSVLQFCEVMVALKLSRQKFKFKKDNLLDSINYLAIGIMSEEKHV